MHDGKQARLAEVSLLDTREVMKEAADLRTALTYGRWFLRRYQRIDATCHQQFVQCRVFLVADGNSGRSRSRKGLAPRSL